MFNQVIHHLDIISIGYWISILIKLTKKYNFRSVKWILWILSLYRRGVWLHASYLLTILYIFRYFHRYKLTCLLTVGIRVCKSVSIYLNAPRHKCDKCVTFPSTTRMENDNKHLKSLWHLSNVVNYAFASVFEFCTYFFFTVIHF